MAEDPPSRPGARVCVLLVDDEPNVRSALSRLLARHGFDVVTADGGRAALDVARTRPDVSVVLSDIVMPDLDGVDTLRELAVLRPELPVVLMSGYAGVASAEVTELGVPFLQKPFSSDEVIDVLRRAVHDGRRRVHTAPPEAPAATPPDAITGSASRRATRRS